MITVLKKLSPYILIIIGLLLLFFINNALPVGVCVLLGLIMLIERKWPEKWETEE